MTQYFLEPKCLAGRVKVELDLCNYAKESDLNVTCFHASKFAKKLDLANLKSTKYKLDTDQLKNPPTNLSNLKSS